MSHDSDATIPADELRHLARALAAVLEDVHALARAPDGSGERLTDRLGAHLACDPRAVPVLSHEFPHYQLVDVQVAIESWAQAVPGREVEIVGVAGEQRRFHPLGELLNDPHGVRVGPVEYTDVADSPDSTRRCVRFGVFLLTDGEHRAAALLRGADPHGPMQHAMLELMDPGAEAGPALMADLRRLAVERSVLRGQVLALGPGEGHHYGQMRFLPRPRMHRHELVLPDASLARIERHVIAIAGHRARLQAAGQHLKRGVLLYGTPGTGKTHTVRYLLSQLTGMTAFVLSGQALQLIGQACALARVLQPSMVILEDIDLIAADRSFGPIGANPLLFEVLNQIDGLGDDVDVTFLLTTNRADILERALAERPGRVDAAIEIAPPDDQGRIRLFRLYAAPLGVAALPDEDLQAAVTATEGRTATYIREVVRRAALLAADHQPDGDLTVDGAMLAEAAEGLRSDRAALTQALLGSSGQPDAEPPFTDAPAPMPARAFVRRARPARPLHRGGFPPGDDPKPFAPDQ